jgi:hypothetical protein
MLSPTGTNGMIGALITAISARSRDIHQHYSAWLYRQALLSLGGSVLAEQAARDVTADESVPCRRITQTGVSTDSNVADRGSAEEPKSWGTGGK